MKSGKDIEEGTAARVRCGVLLGSVLQIKRDCETAGTTNQTPNNEPVHEPSVSSFLRELFHLRYVILVICWESFWILRDILHAK